MQTKTQKSSGGGIVNGILNCVETVGNKDPHPIVLFVILSLVIMVVSKIVVFAGVTAIHPNTGEVVEAVDLLSVSGLQNFLSSMVTNFQTFGPLALVLFAMLGIGIADKSGMMSTLLRRFLVGLPKPLVTFIIIFAGALCNAAGDAGNVILPPLAAIIFMSMGRNPLIGIVVAFVGVEGGFGANLMVTLTDVLAASYTVPAAQIVDPSFNASPAMNYYFMVVSLFLIAGIGTLVTEKIIAPRLERESYDKPADALHSELLELTPAQIKGLKNAGISALVYIAVVVALCLGKHPFMGDPETGSLLASSSPFMQGLIPLIVFLFMIPAIAYGKAAGSITNVRSIIDMAGTALSEMGPYIVICAVASQFLALFKQSNLALILAVKGADFLGKSGISGIMLIILFILLVGFINMFMGSASAKWAIMAPVFVPMFMLIGISPALTQVAFRIADSATNPINFVGSYVPMVLTYMQKYKKDAGLGTLFSNTLPYAVAELVIWPMLLVIFILLNIPLGPA